jgi:hypothetical protein
VNLHYGYPGSKGHSGHLGLQTLFFLFLRSRIARVQVTWRIEFIPYDLANPVGSLPIPLQFAKSEN